jgi:VWFA-related protein
MFPTAKGVSLYPAVRNIGKCPRYLFFILVDYFRIARHPEETRRRHPSTDEASIRLQKKEYSRSEDLMESIWGLCCGTILLSLFSVQGSFARAQQPSSDVPTIRVTSRLVYLDVTVLDKRGHPVVTGLTKDDFTITEDKKPQRIFSFEAPETHVVDANATDDDRSGKAPITIFVLDVLDSTTEDFGYIRQMVHKYLKSQPAQLNSPAELMVLGNNSLEMVQGYTRSRADLLDALAHIPPVVPFKRMNGGFAGERFYRSCEALQQIALQNKGVPGRKNIIWLGPGAPNLSSRFLLPASDEKVHKLLHATTNMLVDSRASLFVIFPGLGLSPITAEAGMTIGDDDPFSGDMNFGVLVNETGGKLFTLNDIDTEIRKSEELGSKYYTLTYQPPEDPADGKFRRVRVTLRDPALRAVTKTGYFSSDKDELSGPRSQTVINIAEAAKATIPFESLGVTVENLVRHPDTGTAEFTIVLAARNLDWQPAEDGKSTIDFLLAAASLNGRRDFLASRLQRLTVITNSQDASLLAGVGAHQSMTIRIPRHTQNVRVVIQTEANGRTGAVELDRKTIDSAPAAPTPEPRLIPHPLKQPAPVAPLRP